MIVRKWNNDGNTSDPIVDCHERTHGINCLHIASIFNNPLLSYIYRSNKFNGSSNHARLVGLITVKDAEYKF